MNQAKKKIANTIKKIKRTILLSGFSKFEGLLFYIRFSTRKIFTGKHQRTVLIYISSINPSAMRLFQIFSHFLYSGYTCYFDISFSRYMKLKRYGKKATLFKGVYPYTKMMKHYSIIASDNKEYLESIDEKALKIFINFRILKYLDTISNADIFYPLGPFFKYNYPSVETDILSKALTFERKIGAFFVGNIKSTTYNADRTKALFNVNTRYETFNYIIYNLPKDVVYIPSNIDSFLKDIDRGLLREKIVLLDTNNFEISKKHYFYILLRTDFFIHMSGVIYPYCHNQIESMMAGCIPITQFANFFIPRFQQETDSLLFESLDNLINILSKVNSGYFKNTTQAMRKNIIEYYREHYSFQSFANKLSHIADNNLNYTNYYITTGASSIINELLPEQK